MSLRTVSWAALAAVALLVPPAASDDGAGTAQDLRPASSFTAIADPRERSLALFAEAGKVLLHPRCVNCHPSGDSPLQGEEGALHEPPARRGRGGLGVVGMQCRTCHHDANFEPGRVPGTPHWVLAPRRMAWQGLSLGEICEQIKDPERNGHRTLEEIVEHMSEDSLVAWGWQPGADRRPVPGTQEDFGGLVRAWVESGAACPPLE